MAPAAELEHVAIHLSEAGLVVTAPVGLDREPALGPEDGGVCAEDARVPVQDPAVDRDARAGGEEAAAQIGAARGDEAGDVEADGRAEAHGFFEAGLEVREGLGFGEGHGW